MNALAQIFKKDHNIVIGAVHLPPLPGYPDFPGYERAIADALTDTSALVEGGVDGIIFENNYDLPHTVTIMPETKEAMIRIGKEIKSRTNLPVGVSVLWNDYRSALEIAKSLDLQFIRIPVYVDTVKTSYGTVVGDSTEVIEYRKSIGAEAVALLTDIHVKHAELLADEPIQDAALRAVSAGADALIVTGKWTGNAPDMGELQSVREAVGDFPILCGSGVDKDNVGQLFALANGAIVSTSLKDGLVKSGEVNLKSFDQRISREKVNLLITQLSSGVKN